MLKIGIPRALAYFIYYPFWNIFFTGLGHEVIVSEPTSRAILDQGVREAVNDACIPIKIYHGHAASLIDKVDYIFCPRLVSLRKHGDFGTETFCPKFLGLPDMVRLAVKKLPPLIDVRIDLKKGRNELKNVCLQVGKTLGNKEADVIKVMRRACRIQRRYQKYLSRGMFPDEAMDLVLEQKQPRLKTAKPEFTIAVVGYPYTIYDQYINVGLIRLLKAENVRVVTQDMLSNRVLNRAGKVLPKRMFWYFSNRAIYGVLHFLKCPEIDGIIHVTAFACGPDAMVDRLMDMEIHHRSKIPYMSVMIDEQTGEAGIKTRVEAFIDMLRYRKEGHRNED